MKKRKLIISFFIVFALIFCVVYFGIVSFGIDGMDFISSNKDKYKKDNKTLQENIILSLGDEKNFNGIEIKLESIEKDYENGEIRFTLYIKNNIGFFSGEILSYGYFFADEPEIDYSKTGTVILNHKNESIKAKRRAISFGRDCSRDIFAVKINDLNKIDINTLSITIFDFYYIEYTRK